ncbi:ankyrin repeat domain-containing protein 26-like [Sus scrofa]|uniref:ankyrin repeat domain-containing protein 26-like n=1 Tax=Sus scrofa TaxID=9823 RepID=UPI000A2AF21F|nr:ankyrin repeat domain-containing protein 26-like [Sus scrofa]
MKKHFGFNSKKPVLFRDSSTSPCGEGGNGVNQQSGYHIRDKDLGKIHRAACEGNVARVQQILLLRKNGPNDKDKRNRTALHLACASGHPAVVTLLVKWKCQLNLCDNENKTALVKAVQCQQEECTSILLEHGADPNLVDVKGYTALHYAVFGQNISIAAKLLSHKANIEARDKDDLTPLLLAVSENEQQMVGFLLRNQANIHAVDKMKRTALILAVNFASSSVVRLLLEQGVDISPQDRYGRNAEDYAVIKGHHMNHHMILEYKREMGPKTPAQDSNLGAPWRGRECGLACRKIHAIEHVIHHQDALSFLILFKMWLLFESHYFLTLLFHQSLYNFIEIDLTAEESPRQISRETDSTQVHESSEEDSLSSFSSKPHVDDTWPTSDTVTDFDLEEGDKKPGMEPKETRTDVMESIPQEPPNLDHFTSVDGAHRENRSGVLSASGLEEEDIASSLDTECASESLSQKTVYHISRAADERGKKRGNKEVEDVPYIPSCMSGSSNFKRAQQEDPRHGGLAVAHMASPEKYPHSKPTVGVKDAVPNKTVGTKDLQASRSDSVPLCKIQGAVLSSERSLKVKNSQCEVLEGKIKNMESKISGLQAELSETKEVQSQLEQQKVEQQQELCSLRLYLKHEEEQRKKADMLSEEIREQLRRKEEQCSKETELKQQLELTLEVLQGELKTVRNKANQLQEAQDRYMEAVKCTEKMQDQMQKLQKENAELKDTNKMQAGTIEELQRNPPGPSSEGDKKPGTEPKETRTDVMESIPQEPPNLDHFTSVDGAHRENRSGVLSASGLEEEDIASSLDTECASESLSQKYVDHLSGTSGQRGKNRVNGEVEDVPYIPSCMSGSSNFKRAQQEDPRHGGLAVAHMASPEKYPHSKPTVGVKDAVPNKTVGTKDLQASRSDLPQSSDHKSPFDLPLAYSKEMNAMIQRRNHDISAVKKTSNQTKPVQDWSKKLWYASNFHAKKRKSIKPKLETWTCPPNSNRTSKIYLKEELQQSMQRCKNKAEKEKKQHRSSVMAVSENNHGSDDDSGLMQQGERGKTNHQWFPTVENGDSDSSSSGMHMKEVWKNEREKWSSKGPVIPPIFEKADSLPIDLLHVNDDRSLSERDQDDGRPIKRTPNEENKVKEQINSVDDFDDLTQLPETASKDRELLSSKSMNAMLLIEQLGTECKDSVSVLKKQDSVLSDDSLLEIKKSHYELLTGKIKKMKSKIIGLRKELSEAKEVKSQLEHQILEWQQEFYSLRCTLKQEEEKRRNVYKLYEKTRKELRRRKERYDKEAEMKQQLELTVQALDMELRAVRNNLNQHVEFAGRCKPPQLQGDESHEKAKELLPKNHMSQNEIAMLKHEIEAVENHNQEMEKKYFMDMKIVKKKYAEVRKTIKLNEETLTKIILERNELTAENTMLKSELENERQNKERLERQVESYRSRLAATHDQVQSQTSKRDLELAFQRGRDKCLPLQDEINLDVSNLKDNEVHSQQLSKSEGKSNGLETELHHGRDALREKSLVFETVPVQRDLSQAQCQKEIEHMPPSEQGKVKKYMDKQESSKGRLSQLESENLLLRQQLDDLQNKKESQQKRVINIQDQFQNTVKSLQAKSEKQYLMLEERNKELTKEYSHLKESINQYENEAMEREVVVEQLQQELADSLKKQSLSEASLELMLRDCAKLEDERQDLKKKVHQMTSKLQEAQELHIEALKCAEETQDHMQKLEIQTAKLKVMNKKQVAKIEQLRRNSLSTSLSEQEKEELQQLMELKQFLESQLDRQKKKNDGLEKEITGLKECLEMARREVNENEKGEPSAHGVVKINPTEMDIQIDTLKHKTQTASQENLAQYLESERSKENTSHESSCKTELEKYKQLYREELKLRKSLEKKRNKLHRTNRRLAKTCVKRLMEKEQNRSLPQTFTTSPVLEPPGAENIHNSSGFRGNTTTRETLLFSTSRSRPSFDSIVTALMKSQREMEENMNKELAEATAELDSVYWRASRLRSTGDLLKTSHSHMYRF